jgi:hypothetical protein
LQEAIRRFLEAHRPELMERFIREDIEWDCVAELSAHARSSAMPALADPRLLDVVIEELKDA